MTPFLQAENLSKRFGDQLLFENISFTIFEHQKVAIIANTQYGDAKQEQDLLALGADDFLYKPTTPALVQSRLKCALRKYITVGE